MLPITPVYGLQRRRGGFGDDEGDVVVLFVGGKLADVGDDGVEEGLRGEAAMAAEGFDEAAFAEFIAIFVEGFGDPVGVEGESVAGTEAALADFAVPFLENAENCSSGVEAVDGLVTAENECGQMAAIDETQAAGSDVVIGEEKRGEGAVGSVLREELINSLEEALGMIKRDGALAAEIGLEIGHEKGGGDAFTGNVTDNQTETVGAEIEEVVIIAADSAGGIAVTRVVQPVNRRPDLRKKAALNFIGDFEFLGDAAFRFEFCRSGAALGFEGVGDLVEADQRENVPVNVTEAGSDAAPNGCLFAKERRLDSGADGARLGIELDAAQTGRVVEVNAPEGPFLIFRDDIFGDEDDLGGTADEFVLHRVRFGSDEREDRGAVGRGDGDKAFAGLELLVVGEVEAELVEVEAEAAVEIADEDLGGMDAEVGLRLRGE